MKVFTVEFTIFNGVYWKNVDYEITETSIEKLKEAVFVELEWMSSGQSKEEKWLTIEKSIIESELVFPIVKEKIW
jgi:hypothetical protein